MKTTRRGKSAGAFSLVEILVGLAVVAILSSLLLGVATRMRQTAATAGCAQNLRQIYNGFLAYANDNNGFIPPAHGKDLASIYEGYDFNQYWWMPAYLSQHLVKESIRSGPNLLSQEEAKIFNCPGRSVALDTFWLSHSDPAVSYVMTLPASPDQYKLINITNRSQRLLITEGRHSVIWSGNALTLPDSQRDPSRALRRFHGNTMNLLFYDGHVENFGGKDSELQAYIP